MRKFIAAMAAGVGLMLSSAAMACNYDSGEVYQAKADSNQVIIKTAGAEKTFTLKKETKITLNGKEAALSDLKSGDKVVVANESTTDVLEIKATRA
jgi:hypothetical protein